MRVLVAGAAGLLAAAVCREFTGRADILALDHEALDITDPEMVQRTVADARPDVLINCAAYNDVDGAEEDARTAIGVNALGVLALARAAIASGARFVQYSTDFVFDGEASRPYDEQDRPNPRGVYAASKLLGEWFALEPPHAYVLRVESLFGDPGPRPARVGSVGTIVERVRAGEPVPVFVDRTVSPSYTTDVARATRELLERGAARGVYHCVNSGATTWADLAAEVAKVLQRPLRIIPITLESAARKAPRPKYCALANRKLAAAGIPMPTWQDALRRYLLRE